MADKQVKEPSRSRAWEPKAPGDLRNDLAGRALQGFLSRPYWDFSYPDPANDHTRTQMQKLAEMSVAMADILIAELEK